MAAAAAAAAAVAAGLDGLQGSMHTHLEAVRLQAVVIHGTQHRPPPRGAHWVAAEGVEVQPPRQHLSATGRFCGGL